MRGDDTRAIEALLRQYFEALYTGDAALFGQIFHPAARLFTVSAGETTVIDLPAYLEIVANRKAPAAESAPRQEEIVQITVPTPITAHARVEERFFNKFFTDELTLLKGQDGWKIVSKVWDFALIEDVAA